jgi:uncharacterized protein YjbI with pentapeptide repeats
VTPSRSRAPHTDGPITFWADPLLDGADLSPALPELSAADGVSSAVPIEDLRPTDLRKAFLFEVDLRGANLRSADLRGAILIGTRLDGTDLRGADLRGAYGYPSVIRKVAKVDSRTKL